MRNKDVITRGIGHAGSQTSRPPHRLPLIYEPRPGYFWLASYCATAFEALGS